MTPLATPEEAWSRIAAALVALELESSSRADSVGRVLAGDLRARVDVPAHDVSAIMEYKGFGVEAAAKEVVHGKLEAGTAV